MPRGEGDARVSDRRFGQIEALAYSGVWAAAVAASLVGACGLAIAPELPMREAARLIGLAFAGTLVVYNVDRLRDLERDRAASPARSRFIERHRGGVQGLTLGAAMLCVPLALGQPLAVWLLCGGVAALGLLHRRLKGRPVFKIAYVTTAWLAVVVGLPAAHASAGGSVGWERAALFGAVICGGAIAANLLVSDLRDGAAVDHQRRLRLALGLASAAALVALAAPAGQRPLLTIPAAELLALLRFRSDERYGLVVVDGALGLGALASVAWIVASSGPQF